MWVEIDTGVEQRLRKAVFFAGCTAARQLPSEILSVMGREVVWGIECRHQLPSVMSMSRMMQILHPGFGESLNEFATLGQLYRCDK